MNARWARLDRHIPPPKHPLYGVDASWIARRDLDWIAAGNRTPGETETYGVWLGHVSADGRQGLRVGTFDWQLRAELANGQGDSGATGRADPDSASALAGTGAIVDLTLPDFGHLDASDRTAASIDKIIAHAHAAARNHRTWQPRTWLLDGATVAARTWHFAGAWTGFVATQTGASGAGGTSVVVVGVATPDDRLALITVRDGDPYGIDLTRPLDRRHHEDQPREWHETILARPNRGTWHTEQSTLD